MFASQNPVWQSTWQILTHLQSSDPSPVLCAALKVTSNGSLNTQLSSSMTVLEEKTSKKVVLWEPSVWDHWTMWILLKALEIVGLYAWTSWIIQERGIRYLSIPWCIPLIQPLMLIQESRTGSQNPSNLKTIDHDRQVGVSLGDYNQHLLMK